MVKTLINYQIYILLGILAFPFFAFIIYFIKQLIDKARFVKALNKMKKPLIERINNLESIYEIKEKSQEINNMIHQISQDIDDLKQEIYKSQNGFQLEKIEQIEQEIDIFYNKIHKPQDTTPTKAIIQTSQPETKQAQIQTIQTQTKPQAQNEHISKFLLVYREKDKTIEEKNKTINDKNKSIYILQQKLNEAEEKLKQYMTKAQNNENKDKIIEEKIQIIHNLQQRLQEVDNKFKKIALLHKSIEEKEQIKDQILQEKNQFILSLQTKIQDIEAKLVHMQKTNEESKENLLSRKLNDIEEKIQAEKRKTRIFISMVLLCIALGITGFMFVYNNYIQNIATYNI